MPKLLTRLILARHGNAKLRLPVRRNHLAPRNGMVFAKFTTG